MSFSVSGSSGQPRYTYDFNSPRPSKKMPAADPIHLLTKEFDEGSKLSYTYDNTPPKTPPPSPSPPAPPYTDCNLEEVNEIISRAKKIFEEARACQATYSYPTPPKVSEIYRNLKIVTDLEVLDAAIEGKGKISKTFDDRIRYSLPEEPFGGCDPSFFEARALESQKLCLSLSCIFPIPADDFRRIQLKPLDKGVVLDAHILRRHRFHTKTPAQ